MADPNVGLPSLPEPQDLPEAQQPDIEIERVDDTPDQDRGQPAPTPETYQAVDDEASDSKYSQHVQGRIKQLRHVYHEERRQKEAAQREREALVAYTQNLRGEVEQLRGLVSSGEKVLIDQSQGKAAAEVNIAKEMWRRAHESGDPEEIVKAQEALARAVSEHERMKGLRPQMQPAPAPQPPPQFPPQFQPPAQPAQPQQRDERLEDWVRRHPWWTADGNDEPKRYMRYVDLELKQNGILPIGQTADAYWATVDQRLQSTFPQLAGSATGNANTNGQVQNNGRPPETRSRPVTATSGTRSAAAPTKVRLKDSELRMAKRLGVTPEQYAREVLKIERTGGR